MIRKLRLPIAIGLTLALAISGIAYGDGASDNNAFVDGNVKPKKLKKKKFLNVNLFSGVRNETNVDGNQVNPAAEFISFGKNVRVNMGAAPRCAAAANFVNGMTTQQARSMCPRKSYLGGGAAEVQGPGIPTIDDLVVSVFRGPGKRELTLHSHSETLQAAAPGRIPAFIVKSNAGKRYGQALSVPNTPETGALLITKFNATIMRKTGVAKARCKAKKFFWQRRVTYKDGSRETVVRSQRCKRRR